MNEILFENIKESIEEIGIKVIDGLEKDLSFYNTLRLEIDEIKKINQSQNLIMTIIPNEDELDKAIFIQWIYQYPYQIMKDSPLEVMTLLSSINKQLPLGHIDILSEKDAIFFKYVLAVNKNSNPETEFLNDILDMIIYAIDGFNNEFETLLQNNNIKIFKKL